MLKFLLGTAALMLTLVASAAPAPADAPPRVTALYTTWDDYYFYAAFQVHDPNVIGTNATPTSQPQQDDDVEVFFETDGAGATRRTPQTYQMAVSAAGGAYFSVGDNSKIPQAKAVFTYKYAAVVDGTLNSASDQDTGFTVELAIPWQELGQSGPPTPGTAWGFNAISRERSSREEPANRLYSLSPRVKSAADVQNPSRWSRLIFVSGGKMGTETRERIYSPRVSGHFPLINGSVVSGEWPSDTHLSFGTTAIEAPAPTTAEEPNTTASPFDFNQVNPPPATPAPEPAAPGPTSIPLPGNMGAIRIVPGGSKIRPAVPTFPPPQKVAKAPEKTFRPYVPPNPGVALPGSLTLGAVKPPALIMGIYRLDYNGDRRKGAMENVWDAQGGSSLVDQPINGTGPWFSGLRPLWHRQQLTDLRRSGINVALLRVRPADPLLGRELDALVEALKEMKAQEADYPLIGVAPAGDSQAAVEAVAAHVPAEFRAGLAERPGERPGLLVYDPAGQPPAVLADGAPVLAIPAGKTAVVSPGRVQAASLTPRLAGRTYAVSWQKAMDAKPAYVVVDSWNDFVQGSEVAASRQYGDLYADQTRLHALAFNGNKQWHAKYLAVDTPAVIRTKALYQIPIRLENAGILPWRAGEGYALCPRWYRDGRLFDDSAPRVPIGVDVAPGQSVTLSVGLVARNGYGEDLEPGDYTLVFDIVQGDDRWFSYADDLPLQVPVRVATGTAEPKRQAAFLGTQTPVFVGAGPAFKTSVMVRNDGGRFWEPGHDALAYKIEQFDTASGQLRVVAQGSAALPETQPVPTGQVATVAASVTPADTAGQPLPPGHYRLHWYIKPAEGAAPVAGDYDEALDVVASDPGASFVLSDVPRAVEAGKDAQALLAIQNLGTQTWSKKTVHVGYHWYYLDGVEAQWDGGLLSPLTHDVPPGGLDGDIAARLRAPDRPGRYALAWDLQMPDGSWASTAPGSKGTDLLQVLVTVGGKGRTVPVDLTKYASATRIATAGGDIAAVDFDGQGHAWPPEMLPPDATAEAEGNPLLLSNPGPPLYPSGFYAQQTGEGAASNHDIAFLYPADHGLNNVVVCRGQTITFPSGNYHAAHILGAATADSTPVSLGVRYGGKTVSQTLTFSLWTATAPPPGATIAFRSPYSDTTAGPKPAPRLLGDYTLTLDPSQRCSALVLPDAPDVKILALTLEK